MSQLELRQEFWRSLLRAVETEPRDVQSIRGASGFSHPIVALGVDDSRRRVVIISGEGDARSAALAQADIQAAMPGVSLIMARPAPINLGEAARILSGLLGSHRIDAGQYQRFVELAQDKEKANDVLNGFREQIEAFVFSPFLHVSFNIVAAFKDAIQQLSLIEIVPPNERVAVEMDKYGLGTLPELQLSQLAVYDPVSADRVFGVCSIPIYEFSGRDIEVFYSGTDIEGVREILTARDILQYFFPAPDQLALGMIDRDSLTATEILRRLEETPRVGYPFGLVEIVDRGTRVSKIIDELQAKGLTVAGEIDVEITSEGATARSLVKFRPREGLFARLSRVFQVKINIDLSNFWKT